MDIFEATKSVLSKYATFSGRACRSEYWWWVLASMIISSVLAVIDLQVLGSGDVAATAAYGSVKYVYNMGVLASIWSIVTFLPSLAVGVRRLHDTDRSGWAILLVLIPIIGWVLLIYWFASRGTAGQNQFGSDPLQP
jgi:uncharacterized membrane protein YhaH (DUF805 family)